MLRIVARHESQECHFPLATDGVWSVGSGLDCEFQIPYQGISRQHAVLERQNGEVWLRDSGSTNGLRVRGRLRPKIELVPGLQVDLGGTVVEIEEVASSDSRLGVELRRSSSVGSRLAATTEQVGVAGRRSSPAAALKWVRRLETKSPEIDDRLWETQMAEILDILDAQSVAVLQKEAGESIEVLEQCWGSVGRVDDGGSWPQAWEAAPLSAELEPGRVRLIAVFDRGVPVDDWKRDFFEYIAERCKERRGLPSGREVDLDSNQRGDSSVIIGRSPAMREVSKLVRTAASSDLDVVLLGETGTGKEVISEWIHRLGRSTADKPVAINCAAIPAELLEAELFGIGKGVATGVDAREGVFVRAHGGTLLLDEISEMPLPLQAKLLRVLQERSVIPVGGHEPTPIDIRAISTAPRPLSDLVAEKQFRADLYYRLRGLEIRIPPLRERLEDIPEFATLFAQRFSREAGKRIRGISERALRILLGHSWPGNVRELETDMKRAVALCPCGGVIDSQVLAHLDPDAGPVSEAPAPAAAEVRSSRLSLREELDATERERIRRELAMAEGNKSEAARRLGVTWNGLVMKMKRLGLS